MKIKGKSKNNYEIFAEIIPGVQKQRLKFIEIFIRAIVICQELNYRKISNVMDTTA